MMGILYPLGFEEQKNPALKDGIRHKIQNLRSLKQKTDGASRSSAQIENIKRQSLDIDDFWQPIWDYTQKNFQNAKFIKSDFFEYYNGHEFPEVVIVNYMLSDMAKYSPDGINNFLDNLIGFLNAMPYGVIIINDINYEKDTTETAFGCLHYLHKKIATLPYIQIHLGSFSKRPISHKYFGKRIDDDSIRAKMIEIPFDIQPFSKCNSIQYIIIKHQSEKL